MQVSGQGTRVRRQPDRAASSGLMVNWWLRLTSAGWDQPQETIEQRERVRRSRLTSWIILGLFITLVAFFPAGIHDPPSVVAMGVAVVGLVLAAMLNRYGLVSMAGTLLVALICAAVIGIIVAAPNGKITLVYLPAYDILALPVVIGASILPRGSSFIIATVNIALIYGDLLLQPRANDLQAQINIYGLVGIGGRAVAIQIILAVVAYLWVRGTDEAVRRADRAEELRASEQRFAEAEAAWSREVSIFVQKAIDAISALANGQEGLVALPANHPLHEQATFINAQLKQFYRLKQASNVHNDQLAPAVGLLLSILQRMNDGRATISWLDPRQFSTQVPLVDEMAKYLYYMLQGKPVPPAQATRPYP
jgi:hypothetical protein